ncbi:hypothetical protein D3C83_205270 [compost metagenome]
MSTLSESSEARSWPRLRAPMMGAVTPGWVPTQATATLTGCRFLWRQNSANFAATSCIQGSP